MTLLRSRTYPNKIFRRFLGLFWSIFGPICLDNILMSILPKQIGPKSGSKEPKNRLKLFIRIGSIWERYIFRELLKVFFLFLFVFFFLYSLMDYSTHAKDFITDKRIQIFDILLYYSLQFIKRADLLLPLALLVATIKVLCSLNAHRELVALQASGMKLKKLLRPFFFLACLCMVFNYFSAQYIVPKALNNLDQFKKSHFKQSSKGKIKQRVHLIYLKDDTKLFYQTFDKEKELFFDVIWIPTSEEIWRIKYLTANPREPEGRFVDHLKRNSQGFFEKVESFDTYQFKQIKWERKMPTKGFIPNENRSLSELFHSYFQKQSGSNYEGADLLTQLYFKLAMPLLSFLVVMAISPFCVNYSRNIPIFFIYACGLFGFIAFFTFMDAAVIIGENQVVSPFLAIFSPFLICGGLFTWKFIRNI